MIAALLYFAGAILFILAALLFAKGPRRSQRDGLLERAEAAEARVALLEDRFGLHHAVIIDGVEVEVTEVDFLPARPVRRG